MSRDEKLNGWLLTWCIWLLFSYIVLVGPFDGTAKSRMLCGLGLAMMILAVQLGVKWFE